MISVAFFNNKGGVGKTTLLCNVAAFASLHLGKKICVVDADPQCNATQYLFDEATLENIYGQDWYTINKFVRPITEAGALDEKILITKSPEFSVDVLCGSPDLALTEDFLAQDWSSARSGDIRGIKSNLFFAELLQRLAGYDYVFVDASPSLGAINRSVLLTCDFFVSPMSIDIFSLTAFKNISQWISEWWSDWLRGIRNVKDQSRLPALKYGRSRFLGYVTQQYLAKRDSAGERRGVKAYEAIRSQIDQVIIDSGLNQYISNEPFEIGTVPNLFSLIPMSQSANKPVFELRAPDGVVGAHFAKVKDAYGIFGEVTKEILERCNG
ncbi:ParA family protein [Roseomonas sp. JC162]|uniref:ParA family protein n=1 Tax=Neoroseomonas marina TaxID=1232220 RepID=A0A848ELL1_9PROT|nr:ParA family protein [Neoroseomonas marina]NMJ44253.1 ParA family protein [Neoroseomonas marina]